MARSSRVKPPAPRSIKKKTPRWIIALALLAFPFLQGSSCDITTPDIESAVGRVSTSIDEAVLKLADQSSKWQDTLTTLESQIASDAKGLTGEIFQDINGLVGKVQSVVKDGGQFVQESANCQTDIFKTHAKIALQNLLTNFQNKWGYKGKKDRPLVPYVPIVCSANPSNVSVGAWRPEDALVLSGVDLNLFQTKAPSIVVLKKNGSEVEAKNMGNQTTNYRFQINVQTMISAGLLHDAVQIQVRWNGQKVNQNEIPVTDCGRVKSPCCQGDVCQAGTCIDKVCLDCGQLDQHCCNGNSCAKGACVNDTCMDCGKVGEPCCANKKCQDGGTCVNSKCTAVLPPCQWTADVSEEGSGTMYCPSGFAMRGARCTGNNCDNIALYCCPYMDKSDGSASYSWSVQFSEEGAGSPYAPSQANKFVTGIQCLGSNCDDLKLRLVQTSHLKFQGQCIQGEWFSEEGASLNQNERKCPDKQWVGGMACRGGRCDDLSLYCCRGEIQ